MFKVHVDAESAISNLTKTIRSGYLNEGEEVYEFRDWLKQYLTEENIVLTNSCTSALTLALKLSNVGPGDEVISTAMTCLASNTPIKNLGAKVVWADIDSKTGCIDPKEVAAKITEKTKAVICVNWAGIPCKLKELQKICKENNLKLIQDAAHAFGTNLSGKSCSNFSDFTCYSFQAIKHVTTGDGGAIVCKNKDDYDRCSKLKWFGMDREATKDKKGEWKGQRWEVDVEEAGYKFHMNNIAAAVGLSQIPHVDSIVKRHKDNAKLYTSNFKNIEYIQILDVSVDHDPSYWVYTVILDEKINRDAVLETLNSIGVNAGLVHVPNHKYTCFAESLVELPNTMYFHEHQISLPCGWWLDPDDISEISKLLIKTIDKVG